MALDNNFPKNDSPGAEDRNHPSDIRQELKTEYDKKTLPYSIERFLSSPPKSKFQSAQNEHGFIKFSVENILKPDFGVKCQLISPVIPFSEKSKYFSQSFDDNRKNSRTQISADTSGPSLIVRESKISSKTADGEFSSVSKEVWPAWVYCTRYSDRPSSGPRSRRVRRSGKKTEEKRPRTAFSGDQLSRLNREFNESMYLTEKRRQDLARDLNLNEAQIKIWFQNRRAKIKKSKGERNPLALHLMAQGLYNHSTISAEEDLQEIAQIEPSDVI